MTDSTLTTYFNKVAILSEFWKEHRFDTSYEGFFYRYYDVCHTAYLLNNELVSDLTDNIISLAIAEAFSELIDGLSIESDTGFTTVEELMNASPNEDVENI